MSNTNSFSGYISDLRGNLDRGDATEHTHRPAHGADLVALHLMQSPKRDHCITDFPEKGTNEVDMVSFKVGGASSSPVRTREQDARLISKVGGASSSPMPTREQDAPATFSPTTRVHINATQTFGGIPPEVWSFRVGGYQVCEKWLKDRKGRTLDYADIQHYQKIVVALSETIRIMAAIDQTIEGQGGWPRAFDGGADSRRITRNPVTQGKGT